MNQNRVPILLIIAKLGLAHVAQAGLAFSHTTVEHKAVAGEAAYTALFPFRNEGSDTIFLVGSGSSCGCTVPEFEKTEYAPGESGFIKATFTYGSLLGEQEKHVVLETSEGSQNLALKVWIPEFWRLTPEALLWEMGSPPDAREVRIEFPEEKPESVRLGTYREDLFVVRSEWDESGACFMVTVVPKRMATDFVQRILVVVKFSGGEAISIPVMARISRPQS